jgi:hypothetical protein
MRVKNEFMKKALFVLVAVLIVGGLAFGVSSNRIELPGDSDPDSPLVIPKGDPISIDGVLSKDVYTFVCEIPDQQKPELIYFACGDGNTGVGKIKWDTWEASGASGTGEYFANGCDPDCADGKFKFTKVNVAIDRPIGVKGKVHLTHLTYESIKPGVLNGEWDLAEFYLMMEKNK